MTVREAQEWLERGWELNTEIQELKAIEKTMRERCTGTTPSYSTEPKGGTANPHKFDALVSFSADIDRHCKELASVCRDIHAAISHVPRGKDANKYRRLLELRYLNFNTFEQIAVMMNYSWRHVHRVHREALEIIKDVIECHIDKGLKW